MKTHNYSTRSAILLIMVSLFLSAFVTGQAMGADPRSPHAVTPSPCPFGHKANAKSGLQRGRPIVDRWPANCSAWIMATLITVS